MAQAAAEEDVDDVSRPGLEVGAGRPRTVRGGRFQVPTAQQEVDGRDRGQAEGGVAKEVAARRGGRRRGVVSFHGRLRWTVAAGPQSM